MAVVNATEGTMRLSIPIIINTFSIITNHSSVTAILVEKTTTTIIEADAAYKVKLSMRSAILHTLPAVCIFFCSSNQKIPLRVAFGYPIKGNVGKRLQLY